MNLNLCCIAPVSWGSCIMTVLSEPLKELASTNFKYTKGAFEMQQAAHAYFPPAPNCVILTQVAQRFTWGTKVLSFCGGLRSW